jgi:hypothetical protein
MKRLLASLACAAAVAAAAAASPSPRWGLDLSVSPQVGLAYAGTFDAGFSGLALAVTPFFQSGLLRTEAGVEAGTSPIGWQVLVPIRAGVRLDLAPFAVEALAETAPGIALFRPAPLFVIGLGGVVRAAWNVTPGFALTASAGLRWTGCPSWEGYTGSAYSSLDVPLTVGVRWTFAPAAAH